MNTPVLALELLLSIGLTPVGGGNVPAMKRFEYERPKMGSSMRMIVYATSPADADRAVEAAYARVDHLNATLSDYDPRSEVSRLSAASRHGAPAAACRVSDDLLLVLARASALAEQTGGAFDVTVGPFVRLWRRTRQQRVLPSQRRLAQTRRSVGHQKLRVDTSHGTVALAAPRMRLDLGGIAKGYIADEALKVLAQAGISPALVDAGGDIVVGDAPPGTSGWRVGLVPCAAAPAGRAAYVLLANRALATSGDTFRYVEIGGTRYSHIIDPRTGLGLTRRLMVTVCAPDCMTADSVASAVSVLGCEKGMAFVQQLPAVSVRVCDLQAEPRQTHVSTDFPQQKEIGCHEIRDPCYSRGTVGRRGYGCDHRSGLPDVHVHPVSDWRTSRF